MDGASSRPTAALNSSPISGNAESKTRVVHRSDRSWRMKALQSSIKPFRSRLIRPSDEEPDIENNPKGSPILIPPEKTFDHCNVRQVQYSTAPIRMYDINVRNTSTKENFVSAQIYDLANERKLRKITSRHEPGTVLNQVQTHERENVISKDFASHDNGKRRKHIYYFAGGGFRQPASFEHWILCSHLVHTLTRRGHPTTVTIVSYPLAPKHPASVSLKHLERWYYEVLPSDVPEELRRKMGLKLTDPPETSSTVDLTETKTKYWNDDEDVIFAGDSSGANIALALPLHIVSRNPAACLPHGILLISPPVDLRNGNQEMHTLDKIDPVLGFRNADDSARAWTGQESDTSKHQANGSHPANSARPEVLPPDDARVSPLLADVGVLAKRNVIVNGIIAGCDVLAPDAKLLVQKCQKHGVAGEWLVWDKQMHCFPLVSSHTKHLPESSEAIEWIIKRLMVGAS
ncbi:MAG: hypothetical protein M1831_002418 [Alyxoria varia]|nr:MAG: hypothetical protein M1831_002418 [Alyxoria varia]